MAALIDGLFEAEEPEEPEELWTPVSSSLASWARLQPLV